MTSCLLLWIARSPATSRATLAQIRNYIVQAKASLRDSDLERAHNLAVKANLLSSELIKH